MTNNKKNIISSVVFSLMGVGLLVWIYYGFDFRPIGELFLLRDNYLWIVLTLLVGVIANVLRAFRWRMLLSSADLQVGHRRAVELVFISYLINSVTPRLGELTRSLLVGKGSVSRSTRAFGTVVIEKIADVACLIVVVGSAVLLRWQDTVDLVGRTMKALHSAVPSYALYIAIGLLICLAIGFSIPRVRHLRSLFCNLWQGIAAIVRLESPWRFAGLCLAIWICNFLQIYLLMPCFESLGALSWVDALYLFATASIGVLLPTPSGAGPYHFAIVKTLTKAYAIETGVAKSFALITHGLKTALIMLLGVLAYVTYYWEVWTRKSSRNKKSLHHE